MKKFALVTVSYNSFDLIKNLFESTKKYDPEIFDFVIVDNKSTDGKGSKLKDLCEEYNAIFLQSQKNNGFASGSNIGIKYAVDKHYKYIGLINPDCLLCDNEFFLKIENTFRKNNCHIVGPLIKHHPDNQKIYFAGGFVAKFVMLTRMRGNNEIDRGQYLNDEQCDFITGCAIFIKRDVFRKIGLIPEEYFLYFEETDFCLKAKKNGYKVVFTPSTFLYHKVSSSVGYLSNIYLYYMVRNYPIFARKYSSWPSLALFYLFYLFVWCGGYVFLCIKSKKISKILFVIKGMFGIKISQKI